MIVLTQMFKDNAASYTFLNNGDYFVCICTQMDRETYLVTHQDREVMTELEAVEKMTRLKMQGFQ